MPISSVLDNNDVTIDLFANGNLTSQSSLTIGDLVGTISVGTSVWCFTIGFFLLGVIKTGQYYHSNQLRTELNGTTTFKLLIKPLSFLILGLMILAFIGAILQYTYGVDLKAIEKFFLEARYNNLVGNIHVSAKNLKIAQGLLFTLDLLSKVALWSIPLISIIIYITFFTYFLSVVSVEKGTGRGDTPVFKLVVNGLATLFVAVILTTIFNISVTNTMLKEQPNIENLGVVSSVSQLNKSIIKSWVRTGLNADAVYNNVSFL